MTVFVQYPALAVEFGAVFVLIAALVSRVLLRRFGVPSIVTLLAFGLLAGPSGFALFHVSLTQPTTRALLSLAVVIVLFEATLRIDLRRVPKRALLLLCTTGPALALLVIPHIGHAFGLTPLVSIMAASVCVVTGPTVTGPLMARLRLRAKLSHLLETEGLVLDALGVIVAAAIFTSFTTRPNGPLGAAWHGASHIGLGLLFGALVGYLGRLTLPFVGRISSDVSKLYLLLLGFAAYAGAEFIARESGLTAVIACGLLLDFSDIPQERLVRSFKEDLSMLALSTVFVLLASQIDLSALRPLLGVGAAIAGVLVGLRVVTVAFATIGSELDWRERILMMTVFPRGIVAVSLATYYATQLPAWGFHGGEKLASTLFLVIVFTVVLSTAAAIAATQVFKLPLPSLVIVGISSKAVSAAQKLIAAGYLVLLVDDEERRVAFGQAHDLDSQYAEGPSRAAEIVRERGARAVLLGRTAWAPIARERLPRDVRRYTLDDESLPGWKAVTEIGPETFATDS